jgi:1,2-diacylglycerol 3-beta-galactosyltransferase
VQEAGNVPFVLNHGFGDYSTKPKRIAERVTAWLHDDEKLDTMRVNARAAATPHATRQIAMDLLRLLDDGKLDSFGTPVQQRAN